MRGATVDKFEQDRQMSNLLALVASRSANRDRVQTGPSLMRQPSSAAGVVFFYVEEPQLVHIFNEKPSI